MGHRFQDRDGKFRGQAVWNYKVNVKDPKETYQVIANATFGSQTAMSSTATFTVQ